MYWKRRRWILAYEGCKDKRTSQQKICKTSSKRYTSQSHEKMTECKRMLTKGNIYKCTRDNVLKKPSLKPRIVEVKKSWTVKENFESNIVFFILIIQLCWFSNQGGQLVKNENFFSCTQSESNKDLTVPITIEDEVSFTNKYSLIATINHSGTLNRGHYWAFIKDLHSSTWYSCNDKSVFNVEENYVNNTTSYILFYCKVWVFFPGSTKYFHGFARGFCHFRQGFWVWWPHK